MKLGGVRRLGHGEGSQGSPVLEDNANGGGRPRTSTVRATLFMKMTTARTSVAAALDRLYAAPLDGFVSLRRELSAELRALGDAAGARELSAARKPSRIAWALNQIARRHPERLEAAFEAHATAAKAQSQGDAGAMRDAARAFRERLGEVVQAGSGLLAETDAHLSAAQARELSETVRAAIAGGAESRAQLMAGRLAEGFEVEDPFAGLEAGPAGRKSRSPSPAAKPPDKAGAAAREREERLAREARDRALEETRRRVDGLEQEARQARATARQAEVAAARAQAEADRARRAVVALEEELEKARRELKDRR